MNKLYQEKQNITNGGKNNNYTFLLDNQKTNLLTHILGASFNSLIFKKEYFKAADKNRNILNKINLLVFYSRNLGAHLFLLLFFFTRLRKVPSLGSGLKAGWGSDEALAKAGEIRGRNPRYHGPCLMEFHSIQGENNKLT